MVWHAVLCPAEPVPSMPWPARLPLAASFLLFPEAASLWLGLGCFWGIPITLRRHEALAGLWALTCAHRPAKPWRGHLVAFALRHSRKRCLCISDPALSPQTVRAPVSLCLLQSGRSAGRLGDALCALRAGPPCPLLWDALLGEEANLGLQART